MNKTLDDWRREIDILDDELLTVLQKRMQVVGEIGKVKKEQHLTIRDGKRWQEVITSRLTKAKKLQLPHNEIRKIFDTIHQYSLQIEKKRIATDIITLPDFFTDKSIGIIGFGSFGTFFYEIVLPKKNVKIFSSHELQKTSGRVFPFVKSLEELVKTSDIIMPIVPINQFETVIKKIVPYIRKKTIIIDVCSVKEYSVGIMKQYLPKNIEWIATHPMFGPKTFEEQNKQLEGMKIVISTNSHCTKKTYDGIKRYFQNLGLTVIEMTAQEHDRMSSRSHFFVKCMNIVAEKLKLQSIRIDTIPATEIFTAFKKMGLDEEIVMDMLVYNRYTKDVLKNMVTVLQTIHSSL